MKTSKHPKLVNGQPAISCFSLGWAELKRRNDLAHQRAEEQTRRLPKSLAEQELLEEYTRIACATMWHTDFRDGLKLLVCDTGLFEVAARLQLDLEDANGGAGLDFWDCGYVADLLRELLAEQSLPKGDRLCLKRALAWVEERGSGLRDYALE
jgi:hypothetical protein